MDDLIPLIEKPITSDDAKKIIGYKRMAYGEYKLARILLEKGLLHEACFFINTCIEKEIKAYLFVNGLKISNNHDTFKLFNLLKTECKTKWADLINVDFLKIITKIYKSRYFENLSPGYNFVINKNKFLAELDFTFITLESKTRIKFKDELNKFSEFEIDIVDKNEIIFSDNYLLNKIDKKVFLDKSDMVYEFRINQNHHILQADYEIPKNLYHEKFDYIALKPKSDLKYSLSQYKDH